jgi:hypothetical protein
MALAHAGLGIGDGDFDAVVTHLAGTLTELGAPEDTIGQIACALAPLRDDIVTTRRAELAGQHPQLPPPLPAVALGAATGGRYPPGAADRPLLVRHLPRWHHQHRGIRRECPIHAAGTSSWDDMAGTSTPYKWPGQRLPGVSWTWRPSA